MNALMKGRKCQYWGSNANQLFIFRSSLQDNKQKTLVLLSYKAKSRAGMLSAAIIAWMWPCKLKTCHTSISAERYSEMKIQGHGALGP